MSLGASMSASHYSAAAPNEREAGQRVADGLVLTQSSLPALQPRRGNRGGATQTTFGMSGPGRLCRACHFIEVKQKSIGRNS